MLILSRGRSGAGTAASIMLTAMAATASVSEARAAQPNRPVMAQHTAPFQRAAPTFHAAPVQHTAPHGGFVAPHGGFVAPHGGFVRPAAPAYPYASRPAGVMPMFTHPQNRNNLQPVIPSIQHANPSLPLNNPSALRPNLAPNNPSAGGPNVLPSNPTVVQPAASPTPSQGPTIVRIGPSRPVNSTPFKPPLGGAQQIKPAFPAVQLHDKFWPIHRDSKFVWVRGQRRHFVPLALLGVVLIGNSYWYPDSYVSMEGPACTGFTPDGCQLQWRMVDFDDGGGEPQCVQYCPQVGPPPEQVATLPPPPPPVPENGVCQTTIYSEPNFAGNSAPTGDSQPNLSQTGWRNEISSIVVGAGTWDFFSNENFGGESLRLPPGTYPTLSPEWTRRIGSFMCVEPAPPPA